MVSALHELRSGVGGDGDVDATDHPGGHRPGDQNRGDRGAESPRLGLLAAAGVGVRKARGHEIRPCGAGAGWGLGATGEVTGAQKWYIRDCP